MKTIGGKMRKGVERFCGKCGVCVPLTRVCATTQRIVEDFPTYYSAFDTKTGRPRYFYVGACPNKVERWFSDDGHHSFRVGPLFSNNKPAL